MCYFAVFGYPIEHSRSPEIYSIFAKEFNQVPYYKKILVDDINNFEIVLNHFFNFGGLGANITMPFKERAHSLCKHLTERAIISGAVNVLKKHSDDNHFFGDNTDGIGLLYDLQRLGWLRYNNNSDNNNIHHNNRILIIGAGGASRGIIFPLLNYGCKVVLTNRTFFRAQKLFNFFKNMGDISIVPLEKLSMTKFDLIINATTAGVYGDLPKLPETLIDSSVSCYDLFYQRHKDTPFISWCKRYGSKRCADGLGMLIGQAAYSFYFWHGVLPSITSAIKIIQSDM